MIRPGSPFDSGAFDVLINRHGDYDPAECRRVLRPGGVFITEQVGADNDRDLVEMVLPGLEKPYPHQTLGEQSRAFTEAGFHVELACEAYRPIVFYDVGAFVWFARVLPWDSPGSRWTVALNVCCACRRWWRRKERFREPSTAS